MDSIVALIRRREADFAALPAVIEGTRRLTHGELYDRVDRLSEAFMGLGVRPGEVVAAWLGNVHEAIECELAVLQIGAVWVSLNARLTWAEAASVLAAAPPRAFVTDERGLGRLEASGSDEAAAGAAVVATRMPEAGRDGPFRGRLHAYEALLAAHEPRRPTVEVEPEAIARLRYTSGTTGQAKAAILPHRVYLASLKNLQRELHPLGPDDRALHVAPLTHASGALVFPLLAAGGANVLMDRFDPAETLAAIERHRATTMFVVPTILGRLAAHADFARRDLSSLRSVMYGGAPISPEQLAPALRRLGSALVHIYGMTEAPYPITTLRHRDVGPVDPRLGSVGRPTSICQVRIVDPAGAELPSGEIGEIEVRGENVMSGYWKDPEGTREALRAGWLATGDLGRLDADGNLWVVDRKKEVIISGGFNVHAGEVERTLCGHPAVAEAAVVGVPHPDWGEQVIAFVALRPGRAAAPEALTAWCRGVLSGYKCPRRIEILDELPKNPAGKILKPELRRYLTISG